MEIFRNIFKTRKVKEKFFFIIPARVFNKNERKNFIKYKKKYLLIHKINTLLSTKLGPVYVASNSKNIFKITKNTEAKNIFIKYAKSKNNSSMLYSLTMALKKICNNNEISFNDYIVVTPIQNFFLKKKSIIKACKIISAKKNINSLNTYFTSNYPHPCQIIDINKNLIKFDLIKFKDTLFTKTEKSKNFPPVNYSSCAIRISKFKYLYRQMKNKVNDKLIIDIKSCLGFEITQKEAFEIKNLKDKNI